MAAALQRPGSRLGALMTHVAASGGITLGALGSGLLVRCGPAPTRLVPVMFLAVFAVLPGPGCAFDDAATAARSVKDFDGIRGGSRGPDARTAWSR